MKVAIIGAGNISNTRHIPALKKQRDVTIFGVVGVREKNVKETAKRHAIPHSLVLDQDDILGSLQAASWFSEVDAVVIGVPPKEHYALVEAALLCGKNVLVEKPMMMDTKEADTLIALAKKKKKIFYVMHNFQYADGMRQLERRINSGELGEISSFYEAQLTNKRRRLPEWYNDLPLGLFYDEAPHFIYLLERLGGKITTDSAHAYYSKDKNDRTPLLLSASMRAGKIPVNLFLNFESPICEWYFVVSGEKKIAFYDLFKDILVVLPTDNEHYASDIIKTSWRATFQYWFGFIKNGFKMISGNLLYGHNVVMRSFIDSINAGHPLDKYLDASSGRSSVEAMNKIVDLTEARK